MAGDDLVAQAAAELYGADPGEFISRRDALSARARQAGAPAAAKQIAGLRKPTRSAWVVNQLARTDPAAAGRLDELGGQLRAAQQALDGETLRELSVQRRRLIDSLARAAFAAAGLAAPPAALREEVTGTLGAAVADPQVAAQLRAGTLDRPARREGFGAEAPPVLTLVPPARRAGAQAGHQPAPAGAAGRPAARSRNAPGGLRRVPGPAGDTDARRDSGAGAESGAGRGSGAGRDSEPGREAASRERGRRGSVTTLAEARARAERERRRQAAETAQRRLGAADAEAAAAADEQQQAEHALRVLEVQLADLRQRLAGAQEARSQARARARQAAAAQRRARQALDRLQT